MQTVFDGHISRLGLAKKTISKLEDRSLETSQTEMQRRKKNGKKERKPQTSKHCGKICKVIT